MNTREQIEIAAQVLWDYHTTSDVRSNSNGWDHVIGLGSYDETIATYSATLFLGNGGGKLLFSGQAGNWTEGLYDQSEAAHFGEIAQKSGVARQDILLEEQARNLGENIRFSESLMSPANAASALFVTKPQTVRRLGLSLKSLSTCRKYGVAAPPRSLDEALALFGPAQIINEMVGDLDRIGKYPALGWLAASTIPTDVQDAGRALIAHGFNRHLVD